MKRHLLLLVLLLLLPTLAGIAAHAGEPDEPEPLFPVTVNGKWGCINRSGEITIEPTWKHVYCLASGKIEVKTWDDKVGVINADGEWVIQPEYEAIQEPSMDCFAAKKKGTWDFYDFDGNRLTSEEYDWAGQFRDGLALVKRDGVKNSYLNRDFEQALDVSWAKSAGQFREGLALFQDFNDKFGYIDTAGEVVIPAEFNGVASFHDGHVIKQLGFDIEGNYEWFFLLDRQGNKVIGPTKTYLLDYRDGMLMARQDGGSGWMDLNQTWLIEPRYKKAVPFENDRSVVMTQEGQLQIIDIVGKLIAVTDLEVDPGNTSVGWIENGLCEIGVWGNYGLIDTDLNFKKLSGFSRIKDFNNGYACFRAYGIDKFGAINHDGTIEFELDTSDPYSNFSEGLIRWKVKGKYGYRDSNGDLVIEPIFSKASDFHEGLARVCNSSNLWGYIDKTGNMLIKPRFEQANKFSEGIAAVKDGGYWGYIDPEGDWVIEPRFELAYPFEEGLAPFMRDGKWGFVTARGIEVIQPRFDLARSFSDGLAYAEIRNGSDWADRKVGFINKLGQWVVEPVYHIAHRFAEGRAVVGYHPEATDDILRKGAQPNRGWKFGLIDKRGNELTGWAYDYMESFADGFAPAHVPEENGNGYWVLIDRDGKVALKLEEGRPAAFSDGISVVRLPEEHYYIDMEGNVVWPLTN